MPAHWPAYTRARMIEAGAKIRDLRDRLSPCERDGFPVMKGHLPGLGHMPVLHWNAVDALRRAERELGPFVQVSFGFGQWRLLCLGAETFDLLRDRSLVSGGARDHLEYVLGNSLLTADGALHRHIRSAMSPTFSARGLSESTAAQVSLETVQRHARAFVEAGGGVVHAHMQAVALDVIFRIVGVDIDALEEWRAQYRRVLWGLIPLPFELPGSPRYFAFQATEWVNAGLRRLIRTASSEDGSSMLHALVRARDEDGHPLSEAELVANLRVLFLAGHETTATTLTFALAHVAERPDLLRRLIDEVAAAGGEPPRSIADAKRLPLCEAVFREAVRLYGPAWVIGRRLTEGMTIRGTWLPAGTLFSLCPLLWGRDSNVYSNPDVFEPDRWIGKPSTPTPYELSQFGGGPHFCLGYHLSWLESVQYLASLAAALSDRKKTLRLATAKVPRAVLFPATRPSPPARVEVVPAG